MSDRWYENLSPALLAIIILILLLIVGAIAYYICCGSGPGPGPGAPNVKVDGIEVTQAIQDLDNSVFLIAGRPTVVRAFFSVDSAAITINAQLQVTLPDGSTKTEDAVCADRVTKPCKVEVTPGEDLRIKRDNVEKSANFFLPPEWLATGSGNLKVKISGVKDASNQSAVTCTNCGRPEASKSLPIKPSPLLRVALIGVQFQETTQTADPLPPDSDYKLVKSWMGRTYPVSPLPEKWKVDVHPLNFLVVELSSGEYANRDCNTANGKLFLRRTQDIGSANGYDDSDFAHYIGLMHDGGGDPPSKFVGGCGSGVAWPDSSFEVVASAPTGPYGPRRVPWYDASGSRWDYDSYGDWYAGHELGHSLGRLHIDSNSAVCNRPDIYLDTDDNATGDSYKDHPYTDGQLSDSPGPPYFVGFDIGDPGLGPGIPMKALRGDKWHDMMTYCSRQWISEPSYRAIYDRLLKENEEEQLLRGLVGSVRPEGAPPVFLASVALAQVPPSTKIVKGDLIAVRATVNPTGGKGQIESVTRVARAMVSLLPQNKLVRIRLKDSHGNVVADQPINVMLATHKYKDEQIGSVNAVLPYVSGKAVLELIIKNKVVDTLTASQNAPVLGSIYQPHVNSSGHLEVRWDKATDADQVGPKSNLKYSVQMRFVETDPWRTVAINLSRPTLSLPVDRFKGFSSIQIRVTASDGFHSTTATSKVFPLNLSPVPPSPP
jgi:hypothetical protein